MRKGDCSLCPPPQPETSSTGCIAGDAAGESWQQGRGRRETSEQEGPSHFIKKQRLDLVLNPFLGTLGTGT